MTIQRTENLYREDINPIDKVNGILAFFQARHDGIDLHQVRRVLSYQVDPARPFIPFKSICGSIRTTTNSLEKGKVLYDHNRVSWKKIHHYKYVTFNSGRYYDCRYLGIIFLLTPYIYCGYANTSYNILCFFMKMYWFILNTNT